MFVYSFARLQLLWFCYSRNKSFRENSWMKLEWRLPWPGLCGEYSGNVVSQASWTRDRCCCGVENGVNESSSAQSSPSGIFTPKDGKAIIETGNWQWKIIKLVMEREIAHTYLFIWCPALRIILERSMKRISQIFSVYVHHLSSEIF